MPLVAMSMKSFFTNILLVAVAMAISAAGAEYAVRTFFPVYDPSGQVDFQSGKDGQPALGTANTISRQRKNTGDYDVSVAFNKYGLRDDKDLADSTPDDVFVVGDSFSFGWGVEARQRYSDRLQAITGVRTFNISTPGNFDNYGDLVAYAGDRGARIGTLVIGVCMENDLLDYSTPRPEGDGIPVMSVRWLKTILTGHSALYAMATTAVHASPALKSLAVDMGLIVPNLEGVPRHRYSEKVIRSSVERLAHLAKGYRAIALVIPSRALWVGTDREATDRIHREFTAAVRKTGLDVVDLRAAFEATGEPLALHFRNDGHWNADGHDLAAKTLAEALTGKRQSPDHPARK